MAKTKISEYSTTAGANTDIDGINIDEGCPPANMNNAIRNLMAALKGWQGGTVTGDVLAVTGGGTGVTTSTGSGNNVLSTSPTLVTPVLGTPTSGTLTNCTGLPLTTGITGTLPVLNGGTGVTTSTGTGSNVLSASPTFTGVPLAPTAASGTNTTQIATTAFVASAVGAATTGVSSFSAGSTGLTPSTGTTGAVTLGGTLSVANGGTGATSLAGAGITTLSGTQTITGAKTFSSNNTFSGTIGVGATNPGTSTWNLYSLGNGANPAAVLDNQSSSASSVMLTINKVAGNAIAFQYGTSLSYSQVGYIGVTSTATTYVTSSDYRLKDNVSPMTGALSKIAQLNPVTYTWKVNGSVGQGFIAHELQAVVPDCVLGEKDAVDANGKPIYQGIDTSFLVATLTAAIKEQQAIIEDLKSRVSALEAN